MVQNRLTFKQVPLSVHETDLPDDAGILGIKAGEQFQDSVREMTRII